MGSGDKEEDGLKLSLSLGFGDESEKHHHHHHQQHQKNNNNNPSTPLAFPLNLMPSGLPNFMHQHHQQQHHQLQKGSFLADVFRSSSDRNGAEPRTPTLRGIDVNRPATGIYNYDEEACLCGSKFKLIK
ncbi:OLC1v1038566C2 [Oldenlandia corymbosa var. corymbosa]|uniref:OLC1v1038566C2 n=1 Tax=Oldenlandia corymbosa var. corymbosa TaxID=529605 RepID=A0AAV1D121_OLDCO|nr:OLC1v1038566C2 [Oldenlandia corymbosa var. corymbosa]